MKATGVVRRIDDLGRVVIPKEIRRTLRIHEGDPLEIFTDREGGVILKKYSPVGEMTPLAIQYAESLAQVAKCTVCITDHETVVAAAGNGKKEFAGKRVSEAFQTCLSDRKERCAARGEKGFVLLTEGQSTVFTEEIISPIVAEGDVIGAVVLLMKRKQRGRKMEQKSLHLQRQLFSGNRWNFKMVIKHCGRA